MDLNLKEFENKNVLITGAGRGIGKRLALGFARLGARIALLGRSKAEIDLARLEIEQNGGNALRIQVDVNDPEQLAVAVDRARVVFRGPTDILICAAAVPGPLQPFSEAPLDAWCDALRTNLLGVVYSCRAVLPDMVHRRSGKILVLSCGSDAHPKLHFSAYDTSKTAVVRFVESLSYELVSHNVQINCFDPGPAYTSLIDEIIQAERSMDPHVIAAAKETRRTGGISPELQLEHVAFLTSEASNHITGKLVHVADDWRKLRNSHLKPDSLALRRTLPK